MVVLPELIGASSSAREYADHVSALACRLGAWVVGGSHYDRSGTSAVNRGVVAGPDGAVVAEYDKRYPYGPELSDGVRPGMAGGANVDIGGRRMRVLLCADFFHLDAARDAHADLIVVPAMSITTKPTGAVGRATWKHAAFARSFAEGAFVVVADWAPRTRYGRLFAAGASGVADPTATRRDGMFSAVGLRANRSFDLDFERLDQLHEKRRRVGFLADAASGSTQ